MLNESATLLSRYCPRIFVKRLKENTEIFRSRPSGILHRVMSYNLGDVLDMLTASVVRATSNSKGFESSNAACSYFPITVH
jgi:hypothetical protein